jgi:phospholipase/lecithinase/hemolysin
MDASFTLLDIDSVDAADDFDLATVLPELAMAIADNELVNALSSSEVDSLGLMDATTSSTVTSSTVTSSTVTSSTVQTALPGGLTLPNLDLSGLLLNSSQTNLDGLDLASLLPSIEAIATFATTFDFNRTSLAVSPATLARSGEFSNLVVFGDSLSDTGNLASLLIAGGLPTTNGIIPAFVNGRFSNGPLWVETFSADRGLTNDRVQNFAIAGATTGRSNIALNQLAQVPGVPLPANLSAGLLDQIDRYTQVSQGIGDPNALYVVWAGANDFLTLPRQSDLFSSFETINQSVQNVVNSIEDLAGLGAKTIAVANIPNLALTPLAKNGGLTSEALTFSLLYNGLLEFQLSGLEKRLAIDVVEVDVFSATQAIVANPQTFGFSDTTNSLLLNNGPTVNPNAFLFWDDLHPTTAGHQSIAGVFKNALQGTAPSQVLETSLGLATASLQQFLATPGLGATLPALLNQGLGFIRDLYPNLLSGQLSPPLGV